MGLPLDSADERRLSWSYGGPRSKRSGERSLGERDRLSGSYLEYLEALFLLAHASETAGDDSGPGVWAGRGAYMLKSRPLPR